MPSEERIRTTQIERILRKYIFGLSINVVKSLLILVENKLKLLKLNIRILKKK